MALGTNHVDDTALDVLIPNHFGNIKLSLIDLEAGMLTGRKLLAYA